MEYFELLLQAYSIRLQAQGPYFTSSKPSHFVGVVFASGTFRLLVMTIFENMRRVRLNTSVIPNLKDLNSMYFDWCF